MSWAEAMKEDEYRLKIQSLYRQLDKEKNKMKLTSDVLADLREYKQVLKTIEEDAEAFAEKVKRVGTVARNLQHLFADIEVKLYSYEVQNKYPDYPELQRWSEKDDETS